MIELKPSDIEWCKQMFAMLAPNGVWGVPRSGLVFKKTNTTPPRLMLWQLMPFDPAMPVTPEQLLEQQESDFDAIKQAFTAAGIQVEGTFTEVADGS